MPSIQFPQPSYPWPTGYAEVADVEARVTSWKSMLPTAQPTPAQVQQWLCEATANIDAALATRGYYVPLQPEVGFVAPAAFQSQLINGIMPQAWLLLQSICAAFASYQVEQARHGSKGQSADDMALQWLHIYDDFMTRIETGADNLSAFGVGGAFRPEIDPAQGLDTGSIGAITADVAVQAPLTEGPRFTMDMDWG